MHDFLFTSLLLEPLSRHKECNSICKINHRVAVVLGLAGKKVLGHRHRQQCSNIEGVCPLTCESVVSILHLLFFITSVLRVLKTQTHSSSLLPVQDLNCFLVDNNGFILLSKERNEIGRFFGEVDGSVMASLIKMGMFKKVSLFDYQAMCKNSHHHASSARPLLSVSLITVENFSYSCIFSPIAILRHPSVNKMVLLQRTDVSLTSMSLDFNLCGLWHSDYFVDRMFVVQQIPDSNLVLVVTQADCDCSRQYGPILLDPKEIKYILHLLIDTFCREVSIRTNQVLINERPVFLNGSEHNATVKCNRMKSQKVRRRPESCHAYHPKEDAKDCGRASSISLSL
ncbi:hypothetical protein L3Q82_023577, partial [Scortum barcoo]